MAINVLIFGCGYLGERTARAWRTVGSTVWTVTRSEQRAEGFASQGYRPVIGDVLAPDSLVFPDQLRVEQCGTILYAIARDRTAEYSQRELYVTGLQNVLRRLNESEIRPRRFLYISSTSVYGQHAGEWVTAESECLLTKESGQICLAAETLLRDWSRSTGVSAGVLRLSGIYGPGRLLSRAESLRQGTPLTGNPDAWLNLIHVDDAVTAVLAAQKIKSLPPISLVSDIEPVRRGDYYRELSRLVNAPPPTFSGTQDSDLNKRCDSSATRSALNWKPQFPTYREGLPHAVRGV